MLKKELWIRNRGNDIEWVKRKIFLLGSYIILCKFVFGFKSFFVIVLIRIILKMRKVF